ncbi:MAG: peptidoglycan DD-metalloendopeptidase family protein, partial [Hyphomicrobiales bacterium]
HMSRIAARDGQRVKRGDVIGYVGSTGRSTGSHLHYEVRIDGRAVNPLPFNHLAGKADILVAVDVTGGPVRPSRGTLMPAALESLLGTTQILQRAIIDSKLAAGAPDILIQPPVDTFGALDFFQASVILRLCQPAKEELKRRLAARLEDG